MTVSYVGYELNNGFIMNWLVGGPQVTALDHAAGSLTPEIKQSIAAQFYEPKQAIERMPVEPGPLKESAFKVGSYTGEWAYYRCADDRLVDLSFTHPTSAFARAWAYTQLVSPAGQSVSFELTTFGPVDIWINRKPVLHYQGFSQVAAVLPFTADLVKGSNKVIIRFANVADPDAVLAFALKEGSNTLSARIPTNIPSLSRRQELEDTGQRVYLDRDVYAADNLAYLHWPQGPEKMVYNDVRFQHRSGRIYAQAEDVGKPGQKLFVGDPVSLREGPYQAFITPRAWEYFDSQIRVTKTINAWVMGRNKFSSTLYGTLADRQKEALYNATTREDSLFAEIARMASNRWGQLEEKVLHTALSNISQAAAGSEMELLGLLGALIRFQGQEEFPAWLKEKIAACAAGFRYADTDAGGGGLRFDIPDRMILFYTCEILAGQLYPDVLFERSQMIGAQHRQRAEQLALAWLRERGQHGFIEWNSKENYAACLIALSYLIDLAEMEEVWQLGSVLMDKLLFSIAVNSSGGVFGVTQGRATTANIKSELLDELSGITRLLWGIGVFNIHTAGAVSFALLKNYELPLIIAEIAVDAAGEIWNREQQDLAAHPVNTVTYRTPEYLLSSAQDYRAGEPGAREHIWQAALGPQSVVFVNHPGCSSESGVRAPNFWLGNAVLPRVAQWKDTLIALYHLPQDDRMGMTHAYFPTIEMDETVIRGKTAFARKGSGYIALTAANGITMLETGHTALRELRSPGLDNAWICQMGQAALDGDFAQFQEKVLALEIKVEGLNVTCPTLRGELLQFSWSDPLLRNGEIQPLTGFKHFENPYTTAELPCNQMEIQTGDYLLRLDFNE